MSPTVARVASSSHTLAELERLGTAQNRKVYPRHGVKGPLFGVSYANLRKLAKRLGPDHRLAQELWSSGNHDARVLATMIDDPALVPARIFRQRIRDVDSYVLADALASLVGRSSLRDKMAGEWTAEPEDEWAGAAGWSLVAAQALDTEADLPDGYFSDRLAFIDEHIATAANRVRHSMNGALIAIGCRSRSLRQAAEQVARRIGKVKVDHGQTSCKTPDAIPYLARAWARKASR
ncbi:MAG: DNA alkylation repair protein [bacterium]|nr:DNA alkylation repair protein [Acidimicrobiia bacterium]MCY4650970.1 DNA alkylation repair protein [bacterium]